MGVEYLISVLIWVIVLFLIAWVGWYIVTHFFPPDIQTPILAVVGLLLLVIILYALLGSGGLPRLRSP